MSRLQKVLLLGWCGIALNFASFTNLVASEPVPTIVTYATETEITSREFEEKEGIYYLKGNVRLVRTKQDETILISADEALYNLKTGDTELKGDVFYEDSSISIKAKRAELNLFKKTGILYDAEISFKKDFMRLFSSEVQKLSKDHFIFKKAKITTCSHPVPDWCIEGRDVDFIRGDRLTAKDVIFKIKNIPVFYSPYIWAPALTERKTGLLSPSFGYSNQLGFQYHQPLYIVLGDHADSTMIFDLYTERGFGKGLELRMRELPENKIDLWVYHIKDTTLNEDFYELKITENWQSPNIRQFISIHTAHEDFYRTYIPLRETRLTRFLSSSTEISYMKDNLRLFVAGQFWQDLQGDTSKVFQLPEVGISIYPSIVTSSDSYGKIYYSLETRMTNFYKEDGLRGQRWWANPSLNHSIGDTVVLSQSLYLKTAYYWFRGNSWIDYNETTSPSGEVTVPSGEVTVPSGEVTVSEIGYAISAVTDFRKRYNSLTHIIEPALTYTRSERNGVHEILKEPFDIRDIMNRNSRVDIKLINRFEFSDRKILQINIDQPYDTFKNDWLPLTGAFSLRTEKANGAMELEYDHERREFLTATLRIGFDFKKANLSIAERFSRDLDILFLSSSMAYQISNAISLNSTIWYDLKGGGLRNLQTGISWNRQCWTLNLIYIKTPEEYSVYASIDLKGL